MNEQVSDQTVRLAIRTGKVTLRLIIRALAAWQCVQLRALQYNGWKPHLVRTNQSTGSESWNRSGIVRFKRRQLGGRDGY